MKIICFVILIYNPVARIDSAGTKDYSFLKNKVVDNLTDYLEAIVQYSIETKDNPKVYTISQFLGNCETCAYKGKMTYEHRQCAAAIAEQMEHGMSSTGMTSMMSYDIIVAIAIQDPTRGRNDGLDQDCLLPGAILMCIDWSRNKNPVHHGGIVAYNHNAYQSSRRSKVFVHQDLFVQPWTHMGWHKGVRLDDWLIPIMVDYIDELRRGNEP